MRLHDFLDYQAREYGDGEFAIQGERHVTYSEAFAEANRLANAFINAGLQIGDRLAMLAKNSIEYVLLYFAASKAGVVPVPLNYRLAPAEWSYILTDAGVKVFLAAGEYLPAVESIRPELSTVERFVALDDTRAGWDDYHQWVAEQPMTPPDRFVMEDCDLYQ